MWRLNSPKPVTIYTFACENTIELRLDAGFHEKADSSALALDGQISIEETGDLNPGDLLRSAIKDFDPRADAIDEQGIEDEWEASLKPRLRMAMMRYREFHPLITPLGAAEVSGRTDQNVTRDTRTAVSSLRKSSVIDAIPDGTLRFLLKFPAGADVSRVRAELEAFVLARNERDWRKAWPRFLEAQSKRDRKCVSRDAKLNSDTPRVSRNEPSRKSTDPTALRANALRRLETAEL